MKKIRIAIMSIFALLLGSVLVACGFKEPKVEFKQGEAYVSVGETLDLKDYLDLSETTADKLGFKFEDSSLFEISNTKLTAKKSGQSYVYATYNNNVLSSMNVIVKQIFSTPKNVKMSESGLLSWDKSYAIYDADLQPTFASTYYITGTYTSHPSSSSEQTTENLNIEVSTNSYQFEREGIYKISIKTASTQRFDESQSSEQQEFSYGVMRKLQVNDLSWNQNGTFSWANVEDAKYQVVLDNKHFGEVIEENSADLASQFGILREGTHRLSVVVYDNVGNKRETESASITVIKLGRPNITYDFSGEGGKIKFEFDDSVAKYKVAFNGENEVEFENSDEAILTSFDNLSAGEYELTAQAFASVGNYFHSDVYKIGDLLKLQTPTLAGRNGNVENGIKFNLVASANDEVLTKIQISNADEVSTFDGIEVDQTSVDIEYQVSESGVYTLKAKQIAALPSNQVDGKSVFVLNSNYGAELEVEKLGEIGEISHAYAQDKSVLSVEKIENAMTYKLFVLSGDEFEEVENTLFDVDLSSDDVKFVFVDKIENLEIAQNGKVYTFKIVAGKTDKTLVIESSKQKEIEELGVATAEEKENLNKTLTWTEVENADKYEVVVYTIDKNTFDAGQTDIDVSGLIPAEEVVQTNAYTFASEGYYLVKVKALTENVDEYISSTEYLNTLVCVAEKLTLNDFDIGFDGTKYYVRVNNGEHFAKIEVSLDNTKVVDEVIESGNTSSYILETDFSDATKVYRVGVVAKAEDRVLYVDSDEVVVNVKKLPAVSTNDIVVIDPTIVADSNFVVAANGTTHKIQVEKTTGARGVLLYETMNTSNRAGGEDASKATYDLGKNTNVDFSFKYFGNGKVGEIFDKTNGYVYLDSEIATYNISKLSTPTELAYFNGKLSLTNTNTDLTDVYVVTIICKNSSNQMKNIVVKIGQTATAYYDDAQAQLVYQGELVENVVNAVSIDINKLLTALSNVSNVEIRQVYSQATAYGFAVYSYTHRNEDTSVVIGSNYATLKTDASLNVLKIEKMQAPEVEFEVGATNLTFTWDAVSTDASVASQTKYEIFVNNQKYGEVSGSTTASYALSEFEIGAYHTFEVIATNPYYIDSNSSKQIKIFRLHKIESLKLISGGEYDGQLEYQLLSSEQDFCDYVSVNDVHNTTGKIEINNQASVEIKVVGKKNIISGNIVTSYIDSETTAWTLAKLETLMPAIASQTITLNDGEISWNKTADGQEFNALSYMLIFKDTENNVALYKTKQNVVSLEESGLNAVLQTLVEGDVEVSVYATLDTYSVVAGGTIYYENQTTLENGVEVCNYHKYDGQLAIRKLNTPLISSVKFVADDVTKNYNLPNIEIEFVGNYDNSAEFIIAAETLIGNEFVKNIEERATIAKQDGKFKYVLTSDKYKDYFTAGKTIKILISALSDTDIPSSIGSVQIACADEISSVEVLGNSDESLSNNVVVSVDSEKTTQTAGGFVFKIEYTPTEGELQTKYETRAVSSVDESQTFDFMAFIDENLPNGGKIKFYVTTNSYASDANNIYYLACPDYVASVEYDVLKQVKEVDLTKVSGGFEIDKNLNQTGTKYVVTYHAKPYEIDFVDGKYYFEFDPTWADGTYELSIYAKKEGYIISKINTINFTLSRLAEIENVTFERSLVDPSDVTISWTNVASASGYIFRIYEDQTRARTLHEVKISTNSLKANEIFGEEFYDKVGSIYQDKTIFVGIIAVGQSGTSNNSLEKNFTAKIRGIDFDVDTQVEIDEFGLVNFEAVAGRKYLYRFVSLAGAAFTSWQMVEADSDTITIEASFLNDGTPSRAGGNGFNLEIVNVGDENADIVIFDSSKVTTKDASTLMFIGDEIKSVSYDVQDVNNLVFVYADSSSDNVFDKIYYGVDENALLSGEVSQIIPTHLTDNGDGTGNYGFNIIDLILDATTNFELSEGEVTLYFWGHTSSERGEYINSPVATYTFKYTQTTGFRNIEKYGAPVDAEYNEDYANTFALFSVNPLSPFDVGIIAKIKQDDFVYSELVSINELTNQKYYSSDSMTLALNITELFETRDVLSNMYGEVEIEFARVRIIGTTFEISDWTQTQIFSRLNNISSLRLSGGTINWSNNDADTQKYYVYLIDKNSYRVDGRLGVDYSIYPTENLYYIIMDLVTEKSEFYVAVQAINEDPFVIPSTRVYIKDEDTIKLVKKNKIMSDLKLENGNLFFDWDAESDFVKFLQESDGSINSADALMKTTFQVPFSFTINDIVANSISIQLKFTDKETGKAQKIEVSAKEFLLNIFETYNTFEEKLMTLSDNAGTRADKESIKNFVDLIKKSNNGIGNKNTLFDKYFENIQAGYYTLEYCLVGRNYTIASNWHTFENQNADKQIYVSEQPYVFADCVADENDASKNSYRLFVKMSDMFDFNTQTSEYESSLAEHYIWKVYNNNDTLIFDIHKAGAGYAMSLDGVDGDSVSVYRCDIDGTINADGRYLMFYLNLNNKDSVLGVYGDEIVRTNYKFQIYAVGNNFATSSKSEVFNVTFLGFDNGLNVVNGAFTWTTQMNRNATIIYKKETSQNETMKVLDGSGSALTFDLADDGDGLYEYIKFITFGEVAGNNIFVDSDIYIIQDVYKLARPQLTNSVGRIAINDTKNKEWISGKEGFEEGCYSDSALYTYKIYNDVSTETSYVTLTDENEARKQIYYEAGKTNISVTDIDYAYKETEKNANKFYVSSIGSTASFTFKQSLTDYNVKTIKCLDASEQETDKHVAITSNNAVFNAGMMDSPEDVNVNEGVLTWKPVEGRGELKFNENASAVYKITIKQYNKTATETGTTNTKVGNEFVFFTDETKFDFAVINEEELDPTAVYFSATVQAFAMSVANTKPSIVSDDDCVTLISRKVAYGNLQYVETNQYILLSEGINVYEIRRTAPIDEGSLRVEDGKILWNYSVDNEEYSGDTSYNIFEHYGFSVLDRSYSEISGEFEQLPDIIDNGDVKVIQIRFTIDDGVLESGINEIKVYATKLDVEKSIKSYSKSIFVNKMKKVEEEDFTIESDALDTNKEVLSFENYFELYPTATIEIKAYNPSFYDGTEQNGFIKEFVLTQERDSIIILSSGIDADGTLVIEGNSVLLLIFAKDTTGQIVNCIYSDVNSDIVLQRTTWDTETEHIEWNDETDTFTWDYFGKYALQSILTTKRVYDNNGVWEEVVNANTETFAIGTLYDFVRDLDDGTSIIKIGDSYYRVSNEYVVGPTYIVTIVYNNTTRRVYTTKEKFIKPTIIGEITYMSVKIKLGATNIQSAELVYDNDGIETIVDLFESGEGTSAKPYLINNETQFKNLAHRLSKDASLFTYVENGETKNEAEIYYFKLTSNITIEEKFDGTLFNDAFEGILDGDGHMVSYNSKYYKRLSQTIYIGTDTYDYGSSLFDTIASSATIKNLNINATYGYTERIARHTLFAGLAITNNGQINNVKLVGFASSVRGSTTIGLLRMAYSGIVAVNAGASATISDCALTCDVILNIADDEQLVRISGIASVNYALIESCSCGENKATLPSNTLKVYGIESDSTIEFAGIANTNEENAVIRNCHKYCEFLTYHEEGYWTVTYGSIYIKNNGTAQNNTHDHVEVVNQYTGEGNGVNIRIGY